MRCRYGDGTTMLLSIVSGPMRIAVAALWVAGIGLAGFAAPLAWRRTGVLSALPFILVVVAGVRLTVGVIRMERWSVVISVALLGAQLWCRWIGVGVDRRGSQSESSGQPATPGSTRPISPAPRYSTAPTATT